jgi:FlaA1/EpsC-like NDP-sugar epimerase
MNKTVCGRTILLTGAGGSIGAALSKAILRLEPRRLVLLDHSERNLTEIDLELSLSGWTRHTAVLGDICDSKLLVEIFRQYQPDVVYHAAAFKHVPLMENNPFAAVRNNALGTATLARISQGEGVAVFVMVSTDKAVNPIGVMGASKRIAELAVLRLNHGENRMSAIRLGNVLGSQGSVVPTFLNQISRGGPVTVTHPDVSRYFFTMDQAVESILLASGLEERGGIFIPQLGAPVKILDIARQLIKDARCGSGQDISITFAGLRAGDKMSEEFLYQDESTSPTGEPKLFRVTKKDVLLDTFDNHLEQLSQSVAQRSLPALIDILCQMIPDYRPTELLSAAREGSSV